MRVIGITLDEVIRDFIGHLAYTMAKVSDDKEYSVTENDVTSFDLATIFGFKSKEEMYKIFYEDAALELFGHPDQLHDNIMNKLNTLYLDILDDEEDIEFVIIERSVSRAIPGTFFFLSKLECEIPNIRFVHEYEDMWNYVDTLITANPIALESKPKGKTSVKIKAPYNTDSVGDFELDSLVDFIENSDIQDKILGYNTEER
tara:strand:- start:9373 stop:9978 length:606 start_codon:yes stop_codon:yes gene_type:complete